MTLKKGVELLGNVGGFLRGVEFRGHVPRLPDDDEKRVLRHLPLTRQVMHRAALLAPFKVRPASRDKGTPAPATHTSITSPTDRGPVLDHTGLQNIQIDWNASPDARNVIWAAIQRRRLLAEETEQLLSNPKSPTYRLMRGHQNDVPHLAAHSDFHDGVWPTTRYKKQQSTATESLARKSTAIDNYGLDKAAGAHRSNAPEDKSMHHGPHAVPNIKHWIWTGPEIDQHDLFNMLEFSKQHPRHDFNIWTYDRESIIAGLDKLVPKPPMRAQDFIDIASFKKRLKIQSCDTLFENNGLNAEQNKKLRAICLREKNGMFRNYAALSDVLRLMVLNKHPGLYSDVDIRLLLSTPISNTATNLVATKGILRQKGNGNVLAATPGAVSIRAALERIIQNYEYGDKSPLNDAYREVRDLFDLPDRGDASWMVKRIPSKVENPLKSPIDRLGMSLHATGPAMLSAAIAATTGKTGVFKGDETVFQELRFSGDASAESWT